MVLLVENNRRHTGHCRASSNEDKPAGERQEVNVIVTGNDFGPCIYAKGKRKKDIVAFGWQRVPTNGLSTSSPGARLTLQTWMIQKRD